MFWVFMRMSWEGWEEGGKNQDECELKMLFYLIFEFQK